MTLSDPMASAAIEGSSDGGDVSDLAAGRPLRVDVWRRFRRNRLAMVGLGFVAFLALVAIFAPAIAPYPYDQTFRGDPSGLSTQHWLGLDNSDYDVFSRIVYGARISLRIGLFATMLTLALGVTVGSLSGYFGGLTDTVLMRVVDIFLAIPYIVLAVALAIVFGRSVNTVIVVIGVTGWLPISRIVRSSFLSLKKLEYVEAARALGFSNRRIMLRHILPNALQPIIVYGTITVGNVILTEAALSFLNVGPGHPTPAWGLMVQESKGLLRSLPHALLAPGGAIFLTVVAFVFIGDGLRDALDPKMKD